MQPFEKTNNKQDVFDIFVKYVALMTYCAKYDGILQMLLEKPVRFLTQWNLFDFDEVRRFKHKIDPIGVKYNWPDNSTDWPHSIGLHLPKNVIVQFDSNLAWPIIHIVRKDFAGGGHGPPSAHSVVTLPESGWNLLRISEVRKRIKYQIDNHEVESLRTDNSIGYNFYIDDKPDKYSIVLTMPLFLPLMDEILRVYFKDDVKNSPEILLTCT